MAPARLTLGGGAEGSGVPHMPQRLLGRERPEDPSQGLCPVAVTGGSEDVDPTALSPTVGGAGPGGAKNACVDPTGAGYAGRTHVGREGAGGACVNPTGAGLTQGGAGTAAAA